MIKLGRSVLLSSLFLITKVTFAATLVGQWVTIDDKTGKARSVIEISEQNGQFVGSVHSRLEKEEGDTGVCVKCPGDFKNKPIQGLQILWGLKQTSEFRFEEGHILDPKGGSVYRCNIVLSEDGQILKIRGFIGISLLGRTQTWQRKTSAES